MRREDKATFRIQSMAEAVNIGPAVCGVCLPQALLLLLL